MARGLTLEIAGSFNSVVIVGIGQMASVLSFGFLRCGHPVVPVTRSMSMRKLSETVPAPELVIVAVGEDELDRVLSEMPTCWRDRLMLLQNELRPAAWKKHAIDAPTVLCAWFEKKRGIDVRPLQPSPVIGPGAALVAGALTSIDVPAIVMEERSLSAELAKKNLYILTVNIVGLVADLPVQALWTQHAALVSSVFDELFELESRLLGAALDHAGQRQALDDVIKAAPERRARGRTAPARLERALEAADRLGLPAPSLRKIAKNIHTLE